MVNLVWAVAVVSVSWVYWAVTLPFVVTLSSAGTVWKFVLAAAETEIDPRLGLLLDL